jgi:hypothetical protein
VCSETTNGPKYPVPDPQHLMLDALKKLVEKAIDAGDLESWVYEDEPESHVFFQSDLDEGWGGDMEEAMEVVNAVGERDLDAKIRYWQRILADIDDPIRKAEL